MMIKTCRTPSSQYKLCSCGGNSNQLGGQSTALNDVKMRKKDADSRTCTNGPAMWEEQKVALAPH